MRTKRRPDSDNGLLRAGFAALALAGLCGCASLGGGTGWFPAAKTFPVDISNLDWVEVTYVPRPGDPVFERPCRLSLMGSGEVEFRAGRSPQVWDTFSQKIDDPHWNDLFVDRAHLEPAGMQPLYQELVDAGLFPSRWSMERDTQSPPFIKVNASIGRERAIRFTDDRRLVAIVERVLSRFEDTALLARTRNDPP